MRCQINHGNMGWRKCGEKRAEKIKAPSWADRQPARHCTLLQHDLQYNITRDLTKYFLLITFMPKYQYSGIFVIVLKRIISWTWVVLRRPLILSPVDSSVLLVQLSVVFAHTVGKLILEGEISLGFLGFVAIFCTINQTRVPTGIGGMSSSWGSGEAEMKPKRKIREYNFIL